MFAARSVADCCAGFTVLVCVCFVGCAAFTFGAVAPPLFCVPEPFTTDCTMPTPLDVVFPSTGICIPDVLAGVSSFGIRSAGSAEGRDALRAPALFCLVTSSMMVIALDFLAMIEPSCQLVQPFCLMVAARSLCCAALSCPHACWIRRLATPVIPREAYSMMLFFTAL